MSNFNIVLARPLLLLLLIPTAAVILIPFFRLPRRRRNSWKRVVPVVLRMTVCILLAFCLAGITFITQTDSQSVMILMDLSDSTKAYHEQIIAYANDIMNRPDGKYGVVAFAGDSVYEVTLGSTGTSAQLTEVVASDTNIGSAMEYAASLLPNDCNRRIILISDGKETSGDAASSASALAAQGYRIDAVYMESSYLGTSEIQITDVTLSDNIYAGDAVDIAVTVESNGSASGELVLFLGDTEISRMSVKVYEGSNSYFFNTVVENAGLNTFRVELQSEKDTLLANNRMYSYVHAAGESTVLVIADNPSKMYGLTTILDPVCELVVVDPQNAPATMVELCDYDEVILANVDAKDLPDGFAANLASYVADFGRSLLTVGGTGTYMYGNMQGTLYEEMMPVELLLTEDQSEDTVALMLVMDCSGSMKRDMSLAKQSAIQSINAMAEKNYIGLISFNTYAYVRSPLLQATPQNKSTLVRTVSGYSSALGTHYTEALDLAFKELKKSNATIKHVIFLSDGEPSDTGYFEKVHEMREADITVSTIALGLNSEILSDLAETGNGRYYYVKTVKDLPDIMLSETKNASVNSLLVESFMPVINAKTELTEGLEQTPLPSLGGYLGVTLKEDAESPIISRKGNPVYAIWNYGLGTVASFMSDLEGIWSADWLTNKTGKLLIERMMTTTIPETHNASTMVAEFEKLGSRTSVVVECLAPVENSSISLEVTLPNGETAEYKLREISPGFFECDIETPVMGIYELSFLQLDWKGNTLDYLETALAVSYSTEYDAFSEGGEAFLESITAYSGGMVAENPDPICAVEMGQVETLKDPLIPIAVICSAFMLLDLVLRLLRWKDIKEFMSTIKSGKRKSA